MPTVLLLGFAAVALFLAAVGTYGVLAYAVAQRTRETAIRMALGSRPADILAMVLKQGVGLGALGLAAGAIGASALVRTIRSMLFGVEPWILWSSSSRRRFSACLSSWPRSCPLVARPASTR